MVPQPSSDLLQLITAAVTPVVMISTSALLIVGINAKHQSMSDRVRTLTTEFRAPSTKSERRAAISRQAHLFERRIAYTATGHRLLYLAIVLFLVTILLIIVSPLNVAWTPAAYALFFSGVLLMLTAVAFELLELSFSNRTLQAEIHDVLENPPLS